MDKIIERKTNETDIFCEWDADIETSQIEIPCGFMSHMLELLCFHSGIRIILKARGDVHVDYHHLTEDLGIVMGRAFYENLSEKPNSRYGWSAIPMDGSLVLSSIDISGRSELTWKVEFPTSRCGDFDLELIQEFWKAFSRESRMTIHFHQLSCDNSHHLSEALFKSAGRSLFQAMEETDSIRSTKGTIK